MAEYIFTNKAVEDLSNIWNYTNKVWSENQADKYYFTLIEYCKALASNPDSGKIYEEINKNILGFKMNNHIIFYRKLTENKIEIIRILHSRINLRSRLEA